MACTWFGVAALAVLFATMLLNMLALILPLWSTSTVVNASLVESLTKADFAAGIWGFCIDVELSAPPSNDSTLRTPNHCYFFHTPTMYNLSAIAPSLTSNFAARSVCDAYQESYARGGLANQTAYASALAHAAGMNATSFAKFLDKSCGSLGRSALAFGSMSMAAGAVAFAILLVGITCRKTSSLVILTGRVMVAVAVLSTLMVVLLWLFQSKMLDDDDDVSFGRAFEMALSAAVLYLVAMAVVACHKEEYDDLDLIWMGPLHIAGNMG